MWFMLGVLIICFTIVVLFRMYIDLRRQDQQHIRLTQNDQRNYDKYVRVTRQEAIGEMTKVLEDLKQGKYVLEPPSDDQIMKSIGTHTHSELPTIPSDEPIMIEYRQAKLDPSLMTGKTVEWLKEQQYQRFILQQQQLERERRARERRTP